jgi:hypothetical protein
VDLAVPEDEPQAAGAGGLEPSGAGEDQDGRRRVGAVGDEEILEPLLAGPRGVERDPRDVLVEDPGADLALEVLPDDVVDPVAGVAQAGRRHHQGREDRDERDRAAQEERDPHEPHRRHADRREGDHFPVLGQPADAEHRSEQEGHRQHVLEEVRNEVGQDADHVPGGNAAPEEDVGLREDLRGEQELGEEEERRRERQQDLAGEVAVEPRHAFLSAWSLS